MAVSSDIFLIRNFLPSDLVDVSILANSSLTEYYSESLLYELYEQWPEAFFVCHEGNRILGFLCGSKYSRTEARVLLIAIRNDFRRSGLGEELMARFEDLAKKSGFVALRLEVKKENEGAMKFYRHLGFSVTATLPSYYSDFSDAFVMWKLL
ncbi:MAG: GNAT family N-acetyltransferase [Candidatus Thermoplasmatota archaeon]|jgi:ribosomal-protein-alanine N-acetyltransferase|nr:GNAT family N-acetyltransferase [Candidatus Thermoplasmatota archaeon]MCL5785382.1 GNAT family N-acetyltransferase [Candidatus Thermoplasmatota archaeon]